MRKMSPGEDIAMLPTSRRNFFGTIAAGTAALTAASFTSLAAGVDTLSKEIYNVEDADMWFNQVSGKHKIVFDVTGPNEMLPFAWPRVFLITNGKTADSDEEKSVVVVLRHNAIPYAMDDKLWSKYKFGEFFKINDPKTETASLRNPFWQPKNGDFKVPGVGNVAIGINELQKSGVLFCACDMAMTVLSAVMAGQMKKDPAEVKKEWVAGILPGIQIVPSGVWAVGRAQEHGCAYCFAG